MRYKYNGILIFAIFNFFIFNYKSIAQANDSLASPFELGIEGHVGFVLKHTPKLDPIKTGTPFGFQLYFNRNTTGTKKWHQIYKYPSYGGSLVVLNMGNKSILGNAIVGLAYMQFHFLKYRTSSVSWRFGPGIAYCPTVWNAETNPLNKAVSAHVNFSMQTQFAFHQEINPRMKLKAGVGMTHISNGSIKKPNLGINIPTASIAVFYNPFSSKVIYRRDSVKPIINKKIQINVAYLVSFSRLDSTSKKIYPAHLVSIYLSKRINYKNSILLGVEGIYDYALGAEIEKQKNWGGTPSETVERVSLILGHELTISKFALTSQFCAYVYRPFKTKSWAYQRFQLKYYISKNIFVGCSLRTHFATADGIEYSTGLKF